MLRITSRRRKARIAQYCMFELLCIRRKPSVYATNSIQGDIRNRRFKWMCTSSRQCSNKTHLRCIEEYRIQEPATKSLKSLKSLPPAPLRTRAALESPCEERGAGEKLRWRNVAWQRTPSIPPDAFKMRCSVEDRIRAKYVGAR